MYFKGGNKMIYRKFKDLELSALGFGTMRLPVLNGDDSRVDEAKTQEMVDYAMAHGINYYDTAWGYHNGNSELAVGKALSKHNRKDFYLATKFPGYDLNNMDKVEEIFEEQLKKCQVEYFDFYLVHNVCEMNINQYLDNEKYGIDTYLVKQKKEGRIHHLGFSVHGSYDVLKRFLEAYGDHMEFCQIQLNYLDYTFQDAKAKIELLNEYQIPVWVMEPLRGGKLCSLDEECSNILKGMRPEETITAWAFRFLQSIPSVTVTLSGMSSLTQMQDNIKTFETDKPLNKEEFDTLQQVSKKMLANAGVPCTACHYCTSQCPQGLDIPELLKLYNEHSFTGGGFIAPMALSALPEDKLPSACLGCRSCEKVCPQQIKISEALKDFTNKLG